MDESGSLIQSLFTPFVWKVGVSCLTAQCILYLIFSSGILGKDTPWTRMAAFTAHQLVVIPVLVYLAIEGTREWWFVEDSYGTTTVLDRMIGRNNNHFCEFVFGMMVFWDIPTCLLSPSLRDTAMVLHHFGMAITAALGIGIASSGKPVLGYYAPFFFGVIELSSIPLILVDLFHPKHKEWHTYLKSDRAPTWMSTMNEITRVIFAISFLLMRTIMFPYVTFFGVLPDAWTIRSMELNERNNVPDTPFTMLSILNVLFSLLQMYWGTLIIRQLVKAIRGGTSTTNKGKTS